MSRWCSLVSLTLLGSLCACGGDEAKTPRTPSASASATPEPTATATEPAPEPRKRKPFEIYSNCLDVVTVVFGEDPKQASAGKRPIAPSSAIEGPRDAEGNQTVWLLDAQGEPLVKVHVTRGMKRVEIGKSCRTLDAR
jgi:hypothetical protein